MEKKINMDTRVDLELEKLFSSYKPEFDEDFNLGVMGRLNRLESQELFNKQIGKYSLRAAMIGVAAIAVVLLIIMSQGSLSLDSLTGLEQLNEMEFSSILMEDSPF